MNAIMRNLGSGVSPLLTPAAGAGKPNTGKVGSDALPFATLLSDLANSPAGRVPANTGAAAAAAHMADMPVEQTTDASPPGEVLPLAMPLTEYSAAGLVSQDAAVVTPPEIKVTATALQKRAVKVTPEAASDPTPTELPTTDVDTEGDAAEAKAPPLNPTGDAVPGLALPLQSAACGSEPIKSEPAKITREVVTLQSVGTMPVTEALQMPSIVPGARSPQGETGIQAPQDSVNLPGISLKGGQSQDGAAKPPIQNGGRTKAATEQGSQSAPVIRQQNAAIALLSGLARQKDLPPDVAAKLAGAISNEAGTPAKIKGGEKAQVTLGDMPSTSIDTAPLATRRKAPEEPMMTVSASSARERIKSPAATPTEAVASSKDATNLSASSLPQSNVVQSFGNAPVADLSASLGQQVIDMGSGGQWIDGLAREIAALSKGEGHGSFRLSPENLGPMRVDIRPGEQGANVTLTVETKAAEAMLMQDRNLLKADAQLAAVKIDDVTVQRVTHVQEPSRADTATGQGTGGQSQTQAQTSSQQGQSGQGQNNAALAQGNGQSGQNGQNARNHKVSPDATVSSQAEPRDTGDNRLSDTTRRARYA